MTYADLEVALNQLFYVFTSVIVVSPRLLLAW